MLLPLAKRLLTEVDRRALWKFMWNFGFHGMRAVQRFKRRLRSGVHFPPFLYVSIINSCQLRCQGCWVDVAAPRRMITLEEMNRLIDEAKRYGNRFFGLLGGEPLLHPQLFEILEAHPDCYFQLFTNGHLLTDEAARRLRAVGNTTPLISIEGSEAASDERRGQSHVLERTLAGLENCRRHKLILGVATSVCQTNFDLVSETWLRRLIELGVHYVWFYTYRVIGPRPTPELALRREQMRQLREFIVTMRSRLPIGIVDAYWDADGVALCPMAAGISHHIGPGGHIEPCPIIQFATETIRDGGLYDLLIRSEFVRACRETAAATTRGCILLERPDLVQELVRTHGAADTTQRATGLAELEAMVPRESQHDPEFQVPERHWLYRFAKRHWFFGFGAYG
ncbi:MAG: radical SAM/SPASM domain-containing protein [Phycisphaerae bacterium]|jgi:MoaA/NifB/PqqE/SkfB family radical SAM enzyme